MWFLQPSWFSDLSAMDHGAKDDPIRFLLAENAELKSRITALEVRLTKDRVFQTVSLAVSVEGGWTAEP